MSRTNKSRFQVPVILARSIKSRTIGQVCFCMAMMLCLQARTSESIAGMAPESPRERVSFNAGWRFQKGDPAGSEGQLAYEKIRNWVTATGNQFALSPD